MVAELRRRELWSWTATTTPPGVGPSLSPTRVRHAGCAGVRRARHRRRGFSSPPSRGGAQPTKAIPRPQTLPASRFSSPPSRRPGRGLHQVRPLAHRPPSCISAPPSSSSPLKLDEIFAGDRIAAMYRGRIVGTVGQHRPRRPGPHDGRHPAEQALDPRSRHDEHHRPSAEIDPRTTPRQVSGPGQAPCCRSASSPAVVRAARGPDPPDRSILHPRGRLRGALHAPTAQPPGYGTSRHRLHP